MNLLKASPNYKIYADLHWKNPNNEKEPSFAKSDPTIRMGHTDRTALPFDDKASYLMWRKIWRDAYAQLSEVIRAEKGLRDTKPRLPTAPGHQSTCNCLSIIATEMLDQRKASKEKAAANTLHIKRIPDPTIPYVGPVSPFDKLHLEEAKS